MARAKKELHADDRGRITKPAADKIDMATFVRMVHESGLDFGDDRDYELWKEAIESYRGDNLPGAVPQLLSNAASKKAPTKDDYTINDTILLEKIPELRFVDKNGLVYRLDVVPWVANGDYRLVRA